MTVNLQIHPNLASISNQYKGILLDVYGVFWGGNAFGLLPGSKEAMQLLVSSGKTVGILSNTTHMAAKESEKLKNHGIIQGKHYHFFITSGEIASHTFRYKKLPFDTPKKSFCLFGTEHPKYSSHVPIFQHSEFKETKHLHEADFLYISVPHINGEDQTDPVLFRDQVKLAANSNLPMICTNPDRFAHEGNPPKAVVRQGSIAAMYKEFGGEVFYIGKPFCSSFETAMKHFNQFNLTNPSDIVMVGDTPETDIRGANNFGMASALVTKTGMMADRISHHGGIDNVIQSMPHEDIPLHFIERLS